MDTAMRVTTNDFGQKTFNGHTTLKVDTEMYNRANDGKESWDRRWKNPSKITVPAGTQVDITIQETRSGLYATIVYRTPKGVFAASKHNKFASTIEEARSQGKSTSW